MIRDKEAVVNSIPLLHRSRPPHIVAIAVALWLVTFGGPTTPSLLAQEITPASSPASVLDRYARYLLPPCAAFPENGAVRVTFLGTTTLLFDDGATQILIDGFFSRPSLEGLAQGTIATNTGAVDAAIERAGIEQLAAIFVAHAHWDHAMDVAYVAQETGAHLFGSASTLNIARGGGLPEDQMSLFSLDTPTEIGAFRVTVIPSRHSPPTPGVNDDLGRTIDAPLATPALVSAFVEGGSFDFLIEHGDRAILVKPSTNWVNNALDGVHADVLFLGTATLGQQDLAFRDAFYAQTVAAVQPDLVVPVHWDDFFLPLSDDLVPLDNIDLFASFDDLIPRLAADGIAFGLMQGYQSTTLFGDCPPLATPQPSGDAAMPAPTAITGTIAFPADLPTGPAATITIRLEDVSLADAPATIISSVTVPDVAIPPGAGEQVTFALPVASFDPRARYTVRAHVDRDGDGQVSQGDLLTTSHIPVLTQGGGTEVEIPVELV